MLCFVVKLYYHEKITTKGVYFNPAWVSVRAACCKAKDPEQRKELVVCREFSDYREASQKRITSEEGKTLRMNRSI